MAVELMKTKEMTMWEDLKMRPQIFTVLLKSSGITAD